tara:strand:- start:148 stop:1029 length:882 start_codon:yes stop_codon:yes gene_type:complete
MKDLFQQVLKQSKNDFVNSEVTKVNPISGGCIHKAWKVELSNGKKLFAKTTTKNNFNMLKAEAKGIQKLKSYADNNWLIIPNIFCLELIEDNAFLFLSWIDITSGNQDSLGKGLACLHKTSSDNNPGNFGWGSDSFIGTGVQVGGWEKTWADCFIKLRLIPQIKSASKWGLKMSDCKNQLARMHEILNEQKTKPSLVHGDLWAGNAGVSKNGKGLIYDPASWWADREVDIAMTTLFGGFNREFYDGYEEIWPLNKGYEQRIDIYNLYHILNHANIFGGGYKEKSIDIINRFGK